MIIRGITPKLSDFKDPKTANLLDDYRSHKSGCRTRPLENAAA